MDYQKFGWFVVLLVIANFLSNYINDILPTTSGIVGWFVGIIVPSGILYFLLKKWGKDAGVKAD
jgi:hypothetical protein